MTMAELADRLDALTVRCTSPDGNIDGAWNRNTRLRIAFFDNSYEDYSERELERQLSALANLLRVGFTRGYVRALATVSGPQIVDAGDESDDEETRKFKAALRNITSAGMSDEHCVFVRARGLERWDVTIRNGSLAELSEAEFVTELLHAVRENLTDHRDKVNELRDEWTRKRFADDFAA